MKIRRSTKPLTGPLDVTAMIDVVLLLLVFFMLNSSFVLQPGIQVNPPRGFDAGVRDSRYVINITAQQPPKIFFNDQLVSMDKLSKQLGRLGRRTDDTQIIIRADQEVSHGTVIEILNLAIRSGLSVIIATQGT
ncbi:MAG: biopolymer transporter ExbD [Verrucomicrobiota bacterium]